MDLLDDLTLRLRARGFKSEDVCRKVAVRLYSQFVYALETHCELRYEGEMLRELYQGFSTGLIQLDSMEQRLLSSERTLVVTR